MQTPDPLQQFRQRLAFGLFIFVALLAPINANLEFERANLVWAWSSVAVTVAIPVFLLLVARQERQHLAVSTLLAVLTLALLLGLPILVRDQSHLLWLPLVPLVFYTVGGMRLGNLLAAVGLLYLIGLYTYFGVTRVLDSSAGVEVTITYILSAFIGLLLENHHFREQVGSLRQANTDPLTGIPNRQGMDEMWRNISDEHLPETCIGLILIDLDNFSEINEQYGHATGDQVLVETARLLHGQLRGHDHLSRWGGEEFALVLPGINQEQGQKIAERIRHTIAQHKYKAVEQVTCSVGLTCGNSKTEFNKLVERADQALYQAKTSGRNRVAVHIAPSNER